VSNTKLGEGQVALSEQRILGVTCKTYMANRSPTGKGIGVKGVTTKFIPGQEQIWRELFSTIFPRRTNLEDTLMTTNLSPAENK